MKMCALYTAGQVSGINVFNDKGTILKKSISFIVHFRLDKHKFSLYTYF